MRRLGILLVLVLALAAGFAGCGDDDGATTTAASSTDRDGRRPPRRRPPPPLRRPPPRRRPRPPPTAPTTTTTTLPADAHPAVGLSWAAMFPADGATATYRVTTYGGETLDLPATIEYGVEWRGGTYDRFVIGTPEPGNEAMAVYFDRSAPWGFAAKGDEVFTADTTGGPEMVEFFEEPLVFSGLSLPDIAFEAEGEITLEFAGGGGMTQGVTYRLEVVELGGDVEVPAGTLGPTVQLQATIGGEFMGGGTLLPRHVAPPRAVPGEDDRRPGFRPHRVADPLGDERAGTGADGWLRA